MASMSPGARTANSSAYVTSTQLTAAIDASETTAAATYLPGVASATEPASPSAGDVWVDTSTAFFSGARLYGATGIAALTSTNFGQLPFDNEEYDTDGFHSTVTNTHRLTIPSGMGGYYELAGQVDFAAANNTRLFAAAIYKNATTAGSGTRLAIHTQAAHPTIANRITVQTGPVALSAGNWVDLQAYQNSSADGSTAQVVNAGQNVTWLSIRRVD